MTKTAIKRYLISSGITFVATFASFVAALMMDSSFVFTKASIIAAVLGGVVVATRAVMKIIFEVATLLLSKK